MTRQHCTRPHSRLQRWRWLRRSVTLPLGSAQQLRSRCKQNTRQVAVRPRCELSGHRWPSACSLRRSPMPARCSCHASGGFLSGCAHHAFSPFRCLLCLWESVNGNLKLSANNVCVYCARDHSPELSVLRLRHKGLGAGRPSRFRLVKPKLLQPSAII
jgi:hypothetical protein